MQRPDTSDPEHYGLGSREFSSIGAKMQRPDTSDPEHSGLGRREFSSIGAKMQRPDTSDPEHYGLGSRSYSLPYDPCCTAQQKRQTIKTMSSRDTRRSKPRCFKIWFAKTLGVAVILRVKSLVFYARNIARLGAEATA
ncbi:uncharacterized protein MYCGRDRAFT_92211 [Zymoseptoria tritici IPO323]|uniref:Uncharacterized protein n=1 Tax=Zymoseptoria tritici (strain CBS 115943 / IPO323) TaxID=336722 RepID=F9X822_ZYMTI|nr:uncharacterized protein MYCGRDRAFT_92211 [Zymoseptoria tritici IPO323]EGP89125.1 hypothetical protein MYCGRDRAFT_92211 [Zymoseptoria tritici IPO323]